MARLNLRTRREPVHDLRSKHREIVRLHVAGLSNRDIATQLSISLPTVTNVLTSPLAQELISSIEKAKDAVVVVDMAERIRTMAAPAQEYLNDIVNGEVPGVDPKLRAKVCLDALSMNGYGPVQRSIGLNMQGTVTGDDLNEIQTAIANAKARREAPSINVEAKPL